MQAYATNPRLLRRFLLTATGLYLLWFFGYEQWLRPLGHLDQALSLNIAAASAATLRLLGWAGAAAGRTVSVDGQEAVLVFDACNGLVLYALFVGFIVAFPGGGWRRKVPFMAGGVLLIYLLNILRVGALALNHLYSRSTVDFNHHYTFTFVVYGCIFLLWMLWVRRYAVQPHAAA
ncbi:archaeosortase/exosortase family protein [Hymenobacter sp. 15J16-1T3B]|uniref:exosortase X n=1 Tax=Hymenobacter sp. 15J16-1T3B TaxID=2886941 RepID=UPI001D12FD2F|nr:archaeosortase/exosortase family protein [Hymenobacter sp. 15J16-1T3B]MCC3159928.1 archaeosortase/exosortase family protein [Hymenobacter sp. 15J16-1T3B]